MMCGYARVSTDGQSVAVQEGQLTGAGCKKVFREKITGTTADRPQLKNGRPFKMTPRQRQEALARRESGELLTEIARSYNISAATISRLTA